LAKSGSIDSCRDVPFAKNDMSSANVHGWRVKRCFRVETNKCEASGVDRLLQRRHRVLCKADRMLPLENDQPYRLLKMAAKQPS
jgi:hypothetical protein